MADPAIHILGTISGMTCRKTNTGFGWDVSVAAEIVPATGESVAILEGGMPPTAFLKNANGDEYDNIDLGKTTGNVWTGMKSVFQEPVSMIVRCKFISATVANSCGCVV